MKFIKILAKTFGFEKLYHKLHDIALKTRGLDVLNTEQTIEFMTRYVLVVVPENKEMLPEIKNCASPQNLIFYAKQSVSDRLYIWDYKDIASPAFLSKYGSVVLQRKVLCTDWMNVSFYKNIWKSDTRFILAKPTVIALFSHFQDGFFYGGYFDYVFLVVAKLCRIKDFFPDEDFAHMTISYPLFNTSYEKDYLNLLDINPGNIVDSQSMKVVTNRMIVSNCGHWYPNIADIESLKRHIQKKLQPAKTASNKVYISRVCRRRILNEDEVVILLRSFGFIIIEDKNRSISEQISIYRNASFIIGPHGASFSNVIWCEPGTQLFEIFSPNYAPDFFLYLASIMKMKYHAYYEGEPTGNMDFKDAMVENITVSIPKLEQCLREIFNHPA
ncbi:glycosyltransferase family 61 protein [Mucilaginibacter gossypii]|uniref:Glycosyltransferase 61 catalytic domain-containing protein n=1 Tax=Mucilaginibacter gossypii TaxID=551996 RepID=A0A1G7RN60_9SPHI|nr:glycosyltransferase family 61 protein [Mucilaginibacter gossypii]SDG12145.1 Protein of unknown function [Mucilaginibacter gossypii]